MHFDIILGIICFMAGMLCMDFLISHDELKPDSYTEMDKKTIQFNLLNMWLDMKQQRKSVVSYMKTVHLSRIAIYGMGELGERFYGELMDSEIEVVCVIDRRRGVLGDFCLLTPEDEIPSVDAIIVTPVYAFESIKKSLSRKVHCPIINLSELLGRAFGRNV